MANHKRRKQKYSKEDKDKIIRGLESYFKLGYSRNKAYILANFPPTTLQSWIDEDETLRIQIEAWLGMVSAKARQNIATKVQQGFTPESQWWLERREKADWSTRVENINTHTLVGEEDRGSALKAINDFLNDDTTDSKK